MSYMESPYNAEKILGMEYYLTDTAGSGGVLRSVPEDFEVNEVYADIKLTGGPQLVCELTKTNWELMRAVKEISSRLGISYKRISYGGTKDKRAKTKQLIAIYNIKEEDIADLRIADITLKPVGYARTQMSLGDLKGNDFNIKIRNCSPDFSADTLNTCIDAVKNGIPNFYGIQRFGTLRPVSHLTGIALLKGDWKDAVMKYAGFPFDDEKEETKAARALFEKTGDAKEALSVMPEYLHYERSLLHYLSEKPEDYEGAMKVIPQKLLSMFVSAVQSYIFNRALSHRIKETDGNPFVPQINDRLIFPDGREDIVSERTINTAKIHIQRGRCAPAIFMPGSELFEPKNDTDEAVIKTMEEIGITNVMFENILPVAGARFTGASRPMLLRSEIKGTYNADENQIDLSFRLPPGHYATTVCREIMKANPNDMA